MSNFLTRLEEEHKELESKFKKLDDFIDTDSYLELSDRNRELLRGQHETMHEYLQILEERIEINS